MLKLIGPFTELISMDHLNSSGPLKDADLIIIRDGGIMVKDGFITSIGKYAEMANGLDEESMDFVEGKKTAMPGFIDVHTHICYGGSRAADYSLRIAGRTYESILLKGGGINDTVEKTRACSFGELKNLLQKRVIRHFTEGVTTIEVKSGYGLNVEEELRMLRVIREVNNESIADLVPTCLAAHVIPPDFSNEIQYADYIVAELFPKIRKERLCNRIDIFIDKNAFSVDTGKKYLTSAIHNGFGITIHADQFSTGGSRLAADLGAESADHLEASGISEIKYLAEKQVPAVVLPGACMGLGMHFAKARMMLDTGCILVIASDWNPGSAPMGDLLLQASVLSASEKLTIAETFAGITIRAAAALKLTDRGILAKNRLCDMVAFDTPDFREILYHQGKMKPSIIWKKGQRFTLPKN
jgi:imidazolonepropionase